MYTAAAPKIVTHITVLPPLGAHCHADARCVENGRQPAQQLPPPGIGTPAHNSNSDHNPSPIKPEGPAVPSAPTPTADVPSPHKRNRPAVGPPQAACDSDAAAQPILRRGGDSEARSPAHNTKRLEGPDPRPPQPGGEGQRKPEIEKALRGAKSASASDSLKEYRRHSRETRNC